MNSNIDAKEREILDRFEQGELRSAPGAERGIEGARQAARNTLNRARRVNLRRPRSQAREEGTR